jgi:hypothetical protein
MEWDAISGIISEDGKRERLKAGSFDRIPVKEVVSAQCFPLYSVLLAVGNPTVGHK